MALFAASTVISERLINSCIRTYLANLINPTSGSFSITVPQVVSGVQQTVLFAGEFSVLSIAASLQPNAQGHVRLSVRFYGDATVTAWKTSSSPSLPVATFSPEIVVSTVLDLPLIAQVVGDQFQFGIGLTSVTVQSFSLDLLTPSLPDAYQAALNMALSDPLVLNALTTTLRGLASGGSLPATTAMIPAFYDIKRDRPLSPGQEWFHVRLPATGLIFKVSSKRLAAGINVAPFTAATLADLSDHLSADPDNRLDTVDVETTANLQFLEDFLNAQVFPVMRDEFIAQQLRLNRVNSFTFKPVGTHIGFQQGVEVNLDLTYWTDSFIQFNIFGNSKVSASATINGYPAIQYGRLYFKVNFVDIDLPTWVTLATIAINVFLPFLGVAVPILLDKLLQDTAADVIQNANGGGTDNSLDLGQVVLLPKTTGPPYRMTKISVGMNTVPGFKVLTVSGRFGPLANSVPRLTCSVEEISTQIPPGGDPFDIRKIGILPGFVIVSLFVPDGFLNHKDPSVWVRWEVLFNGKIVPGVGKEMRLRDPDAKEIRVIPLLFTNPNRTDQELSITCRLYRPLGPVTEEFLNQRVNVLSVDPRPDDQKPYVQWSHWARFWNGFKYVDRPRQSKIHKLPGKGGCKFSNQFLNPALRGRKKFASIRHFVDLPFEILAIQENLDLVCPYCFFGGPDKAFLKLVDMTIDLASRTSRTNP